MPTNDQPLTPPRPHGTNVAPWLLTRLIIGIDGGSNLAAELRRAAGPHGVHDPERFSITMLGVMKYAMRAGLNAEQVRRFAHFFVNVVIGDIDLHATDDVSIHSMLADAPAPLGAA